MDERTGRRVIRSGYNEGDKLRDWQVVGKDGFLNLRQTARANGYFQPQSKVQWGIRIFYRGNETKFTLGP